MYIDGGEKSSPSLFRACALPNSCLSSFLFSIVFIVGSARAPQTNAVVSRLMKEKRCLKKGKEMKKIALIGLGLCMVGQVKAELNLTLESAQGLLKAVAFMPENLLKVKAEVVCARPNSCTKDEKDTAKSIEAATYALKSNTLSMAGIDKKATVKQAGKDVPVDNKIKVLWKVGALNRVLQNVVDLIQHVLNVNKIVSNDMILPILNVAGQQSLLDPLNKMASNLEDFKKNINDVNTQIKDIAELVQLLS